MRVVVSGSTGLIGSALVPVLTQAGHQVVRLVRGTPGPGEVAWDPAAGIIDGQALEGVDAAVHLAGESINQPWTAAARERILQSRVSGTRLLSEALGGLARRPRVLVSMSGIGYYGDRKDEVLTEESGPGEGFLAEVCHAWEAGTRPAAEAGIRVVTLRLGVVLTPAGGMLRQVLPLFRRGLGGRLGTGRQWLSWIALDDVLGVILYALSKEELAGPFNTTSPHPVTNSEFTRTLGKALGRPTLFAAPAFALRLAFGGLAREALLASQRAIPARLQAAGYSFRYPDLDGALRHLLRGG
ncbi:MAG: TIGR01777 family oxidoreductase [Armatimonadota bacterium]|nr:TIGR01777 family oxidoreductase [Armatimonadota bacterium]